jgi:hypothetical protein
MAMRRISWIDQRISDGVVVFLFLPGGAARFFLALADWRDVGWWPSWRRRASPETRGDANHAMTCSRCDRGRARSWRSRSRLRWPINGLRRRPPVSIDVAAGHQVVKKATPPSAMRRRISRPRVYRPSLPSSSCSPPDRPVRDNTNHAAAVLWFPLLPTGASSRTSAASGRCLLPCRRAVAACPRIGTDERC